MEPNKPSAPLNIRAIASAAGVHYSTVSLALRRSRRISQATQDRIFKIAQRMGYHQNPLVSAYMAQIKSSRPITYQGTIAYLFDSRRWFNSCAHFKIEQQAMRVRAEELGFHIEIYFLEDYTKTTNSLFRTLQNRGAEAIIAELIEPSLWLKDFAWNEFACASISQSLSPDGSLSKSSSSLQNPVPSWISTVGHNHFSGISIACQNLAGLGLKKPGLCLYPHVETMTDHHYSAAFLYFQQHLTERNRIPFFVGDENSPAYTAWLKKYKPDVLLSHWEGYYQIAQREKNPPRFVDLDWVGGNHPGIQQHRDKIAQKAVDIVTAQLYRNERGQPPIPYNVLIEGEWKGINV
jgi:LacI family transcriptional regulator